MCLRFWGYSFHLLLVFIDFIHTAAVVQLLSQVQLFGTPWTAAHQASLPFAISWSLLRFMSIVTVIVIQFFTFSMCFIYLKNSSHFNSMSIYRMSTVFQAPC